MPIRLTKRLPPTVQTTQGDETVTESERIRMRPTGLGRFFNQRFVQSVEVLGYLLSAAIGAVLVYSLVTETEVIVPVSGTLQPQVADVCVPQECAVLQFLAKAGDWVKAGAPVCVVVSNPEARIEAHAARLLIESVAVLERAEGLRATEALAAAREALSKLGGVQASDTLSAPADGVFLPSASALTKATLTAGEVVATIHDTATLILKGVVTSTQQSKLSVGLPSRLHLPDDHVTLTGVVRGLESGDSGSMVTIEFGAPPDALRKTLATALVDAGDGWEGLHADVQVVVGTQSLFKMLFCMR